MNVIALVIVYVYDEETYCVFPFAYCSMQAFTLTTYFIATKKLFCDDQFYDRSDHMYGRKPVKRQILDSCDSGHRGGLVGSVDLKSTVQIWSLW